MYLHTFSNRKFLNCAEDTRDKMASDRVVYWRSAIIQPIVKYIILFVSMKMAIKPLYLIFVSAVRTCRSLNKIKTNFIRSRING